MKDAQGHGSNGRGGPAKPIPNSPYHMKSDAELRYIVKDAGEAMHLSQGMTSYNLNGSQRSDTSGKYADQVNDAASVLGYRDRGGLSMHPNDVAARDAVPGSAKSTQVPTHDAMFRAGRAADNAALKQRSKEFSDNLDGPNAGWGPKPKHWK